MANASYILGAATARCYSHLCGSFTVITIKKYPNRRLYDTSQSQYVNIDGIRELVMQHKEFRVIDSKTEEDLTKSILLQIISEVESNENQALLTQTLLKQLIRFYGNDMQGFMRQYLEQSVATFLDQQDTVQGMMKGVMDASSPMNVFGQFIEQNMSMWNAFTQSAKPAASGAKKPEKNEKPPEEDS
ncbi:histidine kinase [Saccharophagus degradans 2-40]|uniref:Histidine kinase n=1 Tax=Saccharophagus degradans (strain 2-40 / ATCC 43961 / DSM 17024) TaxID=203122 RepID=Q21L40_SACD2|nr:polyhydroxyalkanoate synthesis repressor PhaR [Saccharophagus degradans]ABD80589.1 histidine kinase [Saccharophagus degradans 2-40]